MAKKSKADKPSIETKWKESRLKTLEMLGKDSVPEFKVGEKDWLGRGKGTAQMNYLLLKGTTIAEVQQSTSRPAKGSFHSHLSTLRNQFGLRVKKIGDKYRFDEEAIRTALGLEAVTKQKSDSPDTSSFSEEVSVRNEAKKLGNYFSPDPKIDKRQRVFREIAQRQGQPKFREDLLSAYGEMCAVTGCSAVPILEAAHIDRYLGIESNHIQNGILLRSDIHTLFDQYLLKIHPESYIISIDESIEDKTLRKLEGRKLQLPENEEHWPDATALKNHFETDPK